MINATINSSATALSAIWLKVNNVVVDKTNVDIPDGITYKIITSGNYNGQYYTWNGHVYTKVEIERHVRNPKSLIVGYEKIDSIPNNIEPYDEDYDFHQSEFNDDFDIKNNLVSDYIEIGSVPPVEEISKTDNSFRPKYINVNGVIYELKAKKPKLETNVTIRSGSTAFSTTWFNGITQTIGVNDSKIYKVTTSGVYKNKCYKWNGNNYVIAENFGYGELAINYSCNNESIFIRNSQDEIVEISGKNNQKWVDFVGAHESIVGNVPGRGGLVPAPNKPNMFLSSNGGWEEVSSGSSLDINAIKTIGDGNAVTDGEISEDGTTINLIKNGTFLSQHQELKTLGVGLETSVSGDSTIKGNGTIKLKTAGTSEIGGIKVNYSTDGRNRAIGLNNANAYTTVPFTGYDTNVIQGEGLTIESIDSNTYIDGVQSSYDDTDNNTYLVILSSPVTISGKDIIRIKFLNNIDTKKRLAIKISNIGNINVTCYPFNNNSYYYPNNNILLNDTYYFFYYNGTTFQFLGTDVKKVVLNKTNNSNLGGIKLVTNTVINSSATINTSNNTVTDNWFAVQLKDGGQAAVRISTKTLGVGLETSVSGDSSIVGSSNETINLKTASDSEIGGIRTGFTPVDGKRPVEVVNLQSDPNNENGKAYVEINPVASSLVSSGLKSFGFVQNHTSGISNIDSGSYIPILDAIGINYGKISVQFEIFGREDSGHYYGKYLLCTKTGGSNPELICLEYYSNSGTPNKFEYNDLVMVNRGGTTSSTTSSTFTLSVYKRHKTDTSTADFFTVQIIEENVSNYTTFHYYYSSSSSETDTTYKITNSNKNTLVKPSGNTIDDLTLNTAKNATYYPQVITRYVAPIYNTDGSSIDTIIQNNSISNGDDIDITINNLDNKLAAVTNAVIDSEGVITNTFATTKAAMGASGADDNSVPGINNKFEYIPNSNTNYINNANSLFDADEKLDNALNTHTHGNIQKDGTITNDTTVGSGDKLVIIDSSDNNKIARSSIVFGNSTTTYLRNDGSWGTPPTSAGDDGLSTYVSSSASTTSSTTSITKSTITIPSGRNLQVGDLILTTNGNIFRVTNLNGSGSSCSVVYETNIKGTSGSDGTSSVWFEGTAVTGTGTGISATVSGSKSGDMYLNNSTYNVYIATAANTWNYSCNIKGSSGGGGNNYYHTPDYNTGLKIATGSGVNDMYVPEYTYDSSTGNGNKGLTKQYSGGSANSNVAFMNAQGSWVKYNIVATNSPSGTTSAVSTNGNTYITCNSISTSSGSSGSGGYVNVVGTNGTNVTSDNYGKITIDTPIASANTLGVIKIGSGLSIDANTGVVTANGGGSHSHGYINNSGIMTMTDIPVQNGDSILIVDANNSGENNKIVGSSITFDGNTTTQFLSKKGTWEAPPAIPGVATIGGDNPGLLKIVANANPNVGYENTENIEAIPIFYGTVENMKVYDKERKTYVDGSKTQCHYVNLYDVVHGIIRNETLLTLLRNAIIK